MIPVFIAEGYGPLAFAPSLPKDWNGKVLPGSTCFTYEGDLGRIFFQEYKGELWTIRYTIIQLREKSVLHYTEEASLRLRFVLKGNLKYKAGGKTIKLPEGSVNTVWAPGRETFSSFSKNKEYILFHILYSPELVRQLLPHFPEQSGLPEHRANLIEGEWNTTIQKILDAPYDDDTRRFFYENRVRDILFFLLLQPGAGLRYEGVSEEEVARVRQVDALILQDLKIWLSIPVLARKVNMTEFRLKIAYKQVIGMNPFERLREARLQKARQLLLETDIQVKVIFRMVGYKSLSGFEDAFREKFGLPPLRYRKYYQPRG